mgnify:CR=1 FL=1
MPFYVTTPIYYPNGAPHLVPLAPQAVAILRDPAPGDIGWVVQQHGEVYAREYGWNLEFEALVAGIAAQFVRDFRPEWERCWIAELNGQRVGAVFVVRKSKIKSNVALASGSSIHGNTSLAW